MKFKKILLVFVVVSVVATALLFVRGCDSIGRTVESALDHLKERKRIKERHAEAKRMGLQALLDSYKHPIVLYGKVVDQFGQAVPDARVRIYVHSEALNEETGIDEVVLKTDKEGKFSIKGFTGARISVSVTKQGYLPIPALSSISSSDILEYSGGDCRGDQHSVPSNPIVLDLLKIGPTDPMVHVDKDLWQLPIDGTPRIIALNSKDGLGNHKIEFRYVSNWNKLPRDNFINSKLFDWSFEIRVPGGGFIWDESDMKFEAPAADYKEVVRYEYSATMPRDEWKASQRGRYFVKFADNTFGRIQFVIEGASDFNPLMMESWLNLSPGSRNLATENMIINVVESKEPGR